MYKDCKCCLEYTNFKEYLIQYKCLCCNKNYQKKFDENLKKQIHKNFLTILMQLVLITFYIQKYLHLLSYHPLKFGSLKMTEILETAQSERRNVM